MKWKDFTIPSLLAAGLVPALSSAEEGTVTQIKKTDDLSKIILSISDEHEYILAAHRSHSSHGSHGSHRSHRSSSFRSYSSPGPTTGETTEPSDLTGSRNDMSTPPSSVLPLSHGTLEKGKILPGNSHKFRKIVLQVQLALDDLGYNVGPINGELHATTVSALHKYQGDKKLIPSGKITQKVLDSLGIVAK